MKEVNPVRLVKLYDTTLRDGAQSEGISYSLDDKILIAHKLDELGVHFIEGGWPSNVKDEAFFKRIKKKPLRSAELTAFAATRRAEVGAENDKSLKNVLGADTKFVTIFGKTWDMHVKEVLKVSLDENLKMIYDTVYFLRKKGREVIYDAEHFFDAYRANPNYALKTILTAQDAGCYNITFCDTNGGAVTSELIRIISEVKNKISAPFGIHTHNDIGLAVANSILAIEAGASLVQGTFNGYGERCGNANLTTIVGILKTKMFIDCIPDAKLKNLTSVSHFISEVSNLKLEPNQPFVGKSAFAHKGGVHINAIMKNPASYEHIDPKVVGNHRRLLVSELAGKTPILLKARELELELDKKSPKARKVLSLLQKLEHEGYQFEAAEASFEILIKKALKKYKNFFELESFRVIIEKRKTGKIVSEATVKVRVNNIEEHTSAEGDGPVNALDNALRKALRDFYPALSKMHLSDFKVRVLDEKAGTAAKVRVLIESKDEKDIWGTVGVSENIIEASWQALVDSVEYKLLKDKKDIHYLKKAEGEK
ncbi:MAG: citramalate synthase [Candidatus Omnitrophica bacterium CG11_big_fil_rev_8_21_14_0_20_42_13]|uniref:Citramalate synthase n=1 Tax=Candidatus Ghiorseimicrobium undicola TaxID=1974746 RepID=A0A2H0LZ78_9BACT|nr:MAG: citramalate synthase [Candidatus Omnitrophica bacterium CG11_big_fil_rev_8_21_14_0_20_42_13]